MKRESKRESFRRKLPGVKPKVVVLTGAGISAESGIRTFRAADGLWENHPIEEVASPQGVRRNPQLVQQFYNDRRAQLQEESIKPNAAHFALAQLEERLGDHFLLVTQNVDNLHERAGSKRLIHMHGELLKVRCLETEMIFDWQQPVTIESLCPCCQQRGNLRPHIVWFGEMPLEMERIYKALENADLFLSIGTSGNVYPAAGFVELAKMVGAHSVELNLEPTKGATLFDEAYYGPASKIVPQYCDKIG
ncbi:Sir2 family NAD+-dependent deacetylase [Ignatzschineria cameli]|uniref:Sir2 family NAD+-dependent deacetylase n=1 Tax=Ignatzschineria cameli TaxID=2182793 RepID=UPI000D61467A|nr:Sir2 family NAD+-dependent deacetylase [Ignatzschineria cameli]PWD87433.1 NAD-dependent protein deacylase [Ignatzschineria cameli]